MTIPSSWAHILAPQGIKTVTTGADEVGAFLRAHYGTTDEEEVRVRWRERLEAALDAKVVIIGMPMDVGAGFERGAFKGPVGMRLALGSHPEVDALFREHGVVDVGDVRVNPHILTDADLSSDAVERVRRARGYDDGATWPVAPHDILRLFLEDLARLNPDARCVILGGDHSISRVPIEVLTAEGANDAEDLGILHFDAHTDLLRERDGTAYDFATWAYHANDRIGRGGRLQQVGIRVSGRERAHWEQTLGVRQFWTEEVARRGAAEVAAEIVGNLKSAGVTRIYLSNDIDGTDPRWAASTGTMEEGGLSPQDVETIATDVSAAFDVVGTDVVEVAPPLKWHVAGEPRRTLQTAARYVLLQIRALLGAPDSFEVPVPFPAPAPSEALETPPWS